jgi:hypothetical protein
MDRIAVPIAVSTEPPVPHGQLVNTSQHLIAVLSYLILSTVLVDVAGIPGSPAPCPGQTPERALTLSALPLRGIC